ncbi:MAG: GDP-L-fucose synthase [Candidatus Absconditabacterales bacterium]|nr:GDP-L-fucose synthase [Candidatus Absconditabacterales bacterium]
MELNDKIYIAGHRGLVGSAIKRNLEKMGYKNLIIKTRDELDLMDVVETREFFENEKPDYVFLAAAKVGGIVSNQNYPAEYIYNNIQIQNNIIHNSYLSGVKKLIFLGSSCIYPKESKQPIKEEYLLSGKLESTNEPYAIAKIAGIKMCQSYNRQYGTNFIACMPTNLYGPNDNFDLENSHVFPAMIRKFHEAKVNNKSEVELWGDGSPYREFLHSDDAADAIIYLMNNFDPTKEQNEKGEIIFNIGTGVDLTIKELAEKIKKVVGYDGNIVWDKTKPNGTPRKLLSVDKLKNLGWEHKIGLEEGINKSYKGFLENKK